MSLGLVGRKCGMTRIFSEDGSVSPVTVIEIIPNTVTQVKSQATDGYDAVQVAYGTKRASLINKSRSAHLAAAKCAPAVGLCEFRLSTEDAAAKNQGDKLTADLFSEGQYVDVTGTSKGKGFAGGVKRHNFHMQDATHGNSVSHRAHGSTGQCQTPGRVRKGKRMAGHMGDVRVTTQNLSIVAVDNEKQVIMIKGTVPGCVGGYVMINSAVKKPRSK